MVLAACVAGILPSLSGCASELRGPREERLIDRYGDGIASFNEGAARHNDGVIAYRSDAYDEAVRVLGEAETALSSAMGAFGDAERLASESGNDDAGQICAEALEKTRRLHRATTHLLDSSRAFAAGNYQKAQDAYDAYRDGYPMVREKHIRDQEVVAEAVDDLPFT